MEKVSPDLLKLLALELDNKTLFNLCKTSKRMNQNICNSKDFWVMKLRKEFPNILIEEVEDFKGLYQYLTKKPMVHRLELSAYSDEEEIFIRDIKDEIVEEFDLEKGDVVIFDEFSHHSYIWTGEDFEVDYSDDYFVLPTELGFPEFPPNYWGDVTDFQFMHIPKEYISIRELQKKKSHITGKFGEKYLLNYEEMDPTYLDYLETLENSGEYFDYFLFKDYEVYF